jgi:hypothetical protein
MANALYEDARDGRVEEVRRHLENGASDADIGMGLIWAAHSNRVDVARLLFEHGADPNYRSRDGSKTAQSYADEQNSAEMLKLFSEAAQNPRRRPATEKWVPMGADSVAFVGSYPAFGKKLSEVFNFRNRQHFVISENLQTKAEAVSPAASFDDLPLQAVEKALEEFERLGGKPDRDFALQGQAALGKQVKIPKPELPHG